MTQYTVTINVHHEDDAFGYDGADWGAKAIAERVGFEGGYDHDVTITAIREDSSGIREIAQYTLEGPGA